MLREIFLESSRGGEEVNFTEKGCIGTRVNIKEVHIKIEYEMVLILFYPLAFLDLLIMCYRVSQYLSGTLITLNDYFEFI